MYYTTKTYNQIIQTILNNMLYETSTLQFTLKIIKINDSKFISFKGSNCII